MARQGLKRRRGDEVLAAPASYAAAAATGIMLQPDKLAELPLHFVALLFHLYYINLTSFSGAETVVSAIHAGSAKPFHRKHTLGLYVSQSRKQHTVALHLPMPIKCDIDPT